MLFDFKFDWDTSIEVGIQEIDTQHKEFFRIGRDLEQLILTECKYTTEKELLDLLCDIRQYITYHFYTEEAEIARINPEALKEHQAQHEMLKKQINAIDCNKLVDEPLDEVRHIKDILQQWFFEHILIEDMKCFKNR